MSSSSSLPPVLTPRFRPHAEEEPFLPRYTEDSEPARLFLKKRTWLTRGRVILLSALLSLLVWGLIVVVPEILDPTPVVVPVVDFESVRDVNATLIPGGKGKWTVKIPRGIQEPLRPRVYASICRSVHDVAGHVHRGYYSFDEKFVDPAKSGEKVAVEKGVEICDASLTYMLESKNAGFGVALMGLWSAYGLAKKEGRSFFINDRDWYVPHHPILIIWPICLDSDIEKIVGHGAHTLPSSCSCRGQNARLHHRIGCFRARIQQSTS